MIFHFLKTVVYDLDGNFIEEKKESLRFEAFYNFDDSRILFNGLNDLQHDKIFIKEKANLTSDTSLIYHFPKRLLLDRNRYKRRIYEGSIQH